MRLPPRPLRRALGPCQAVVLLGLSVLLLLGVVAGIVLAPFGSRRRPLRVACFGLAYCSVELMVLGRATLLWLGRLIGSWNDADELWLARNEALLGWALGAILGAAHRCLGFSMVLDDSSVPGPLAGRQPVLVLSRHGGPGDSFALVHLLLTRHHRRARIVVKDILQLDPALDIVLNRLGCVFLPAAAGTPERAARLGNMATSLVAGDAMLVFPEGANWTPDRRRRAIRHLRRVGHLRAAHVAILMEHVLPPRPGGILASLAARPDLAVVVVAHSGLDKIVTLGQAWRSLPLERAMTVRIWPAAPVPSSEEDRLAWLTTEWAVVDEWIDVQRSTVPRA